LTMAATDQTTGAETPAGEGEQEFTPTPYMRHIPDVYTDAEIAQGASWDLGAGHYELGFEVNGARIPIATVKGGRVQKRLEAAKQAQASSTSAEAPAT